MVNTIHGKTWTETDKENLEYLVLEMEDTGDTVTSIARKLGRTRASVDKKIDTQKLRQFVPKTQLRGARHPNEFHRNEFKPDGSLRQLIPYAGAPSKGQQI